MVVAFYFRLHLAYFPRPVVAIFARPEQNSPVSLFFQSAAQHFNGFFTWQDLSFRKRKRDA